MNREEAARKNLEGQRLLEAGQYDEAIKLFSEAIEADANHAALWLNRSEAKRKLGREAEAEADKEKGEALIRAARPEAAPHRMEVEKEELAAYAGFWRRFFALLIDSIIIGILGIVVAFTTGISGYLLPFLIAVLYFTLGFVSGRTLGKRMLGLRVVGLTSGEPPNLPRAFLRSLPLAILLSSGEITEGLPQVGYALSIAMSIAVGGVGAFVFLALPVSVIFHPRKRGIHDMLAGTLCVRATASPQPMSPTKIGRKLRIALIGIAVVSLAGVIVPTMLFRPGPEDPVIASWRNAGLVESAEFISHSWQSSSGPSFNALQVRAVVPSGTLADEARTTDIQHRMARGITFGEEVDILVVNLIERKRFGFFNTTRCNWRAYCPAGKEDTFDEAFELLPMFIRCE